MATLLYLRKIKMRKILFVAITILLLTTSVWSQATNYNINGRPTADWFSGQDSYRNVPLQWMRAIDVLVQSGGTIPGTGATVYVDSNVSNAGDGTSWTNAYATLDEAMANCTEDNGDIVYVAQGHSEDWTATGDNADLDVAGVTIIGCGTGENRPIFNYDDDEAEMVLGDASITIANLRFLASVTSIKLYITAEADADGFKIYNCEFMEPESASNVDEVLDGIQITADCNKGFIVGCTFYSYSGTGAQNAIDLSGGVIKDMTIAYNHIEGEYSEGAIFSDDTDLRLRLIGNRVIQMTDNVECMGVGDSATGWAEDNYFISKSTSYLPDLGKMKCRNNVWGDEDTDSVEAVPLFISEAGVAIWSATQTTALTTAATSAIDGDNLDHLLKEAESTDVTTDSVVAHLASSTGTWATFDDSTDSLQAISDKVTALEGVNFMMTATSAGAAATFISTTGGDGFGDHYFNSGWAMIITYDATGAGGVPEGDVRDIVEYVSSTGTFTVAPVWSGSQSTASGDKAIVVRHADLNPHQVAQMGGSGRIIYVDADQPGTPEPTGDIGDIWDLSYTTLTAALDVTTADNGDVIYMAAGHSENVTTGYAIDDAGVRIVGMGEGSQMAKLVFTATASQLDVSAADVVFENIRFDASTSDIVAGIDIVDAGDGTTFRNCKFTSEAAADEFLIAVNIQASADDILFEGCEFITPGAAATHGVLIAGIVNNFQFINNRMTGDWTVAPVYSTAATTDTLIQDNTIFQDTTGQHCIEFTGLALGVISGNLLYTDDYTEMLDPGSMICIGNKGTIALDESPIVVPESVNSASTAEEDDGSNLERLEYLQNKTDDILAVMRATGGSVGDVWYVDSVGGSASGAATTWATAETVLKDAYDKAAASSGDIVFVAPGHAETIAGATAIDTIGVTIIGLTDGSDIPVITMDNANSSLDVTGAQTTIIGLEFYSTTASSSIAVDVDAANFLMEDCLFTDTGNFEHTITIDIGATAENPTIRRCRFETNSAANAATSCIANTGGVVDRLLIEDCWFFGEWSNAAIYSTQINTNALIQNNNITNNATGKECIELTDAMTGMLKNNMLAGDTYGAILDPGSMRCFGNMQSVGVDSGAEDVPLVAGKSYARAMLTGDMTASDNLFAVTGSPIIITSFCGKAVVAVAGATDIDIACDATDTWDYDFSTSVACGAVDQGGTIGFTAAMGESVLTPAAVGASGSVGPGVNWYCEEGIITSNVNAAGGNGQIEWYMIFTPVESGGEVVPQ